VTWKKRWEIGKSGDGFAVLSGLKLQKREGILARKCHGTRREVRERTGALEVVMLGSRPSSSNKVLISMPI
jgi:hypothetical protein